MKKKFLAMMAVSMMGLLMLSACQTNKKTADSATTETTAKTEVTVKDTNGQLTVPKNPQKVVVFDNGSLDTMDALGVGDRVVGAPTKNIPAYLKKYQKVESAGGIKEPDLEKINQLKPDLIIISGRQQDYQEQLKAIAPTIYLAVDAKNPWASTKQNIETLGTIFDKEEVAKEKITGLEKEIADVKKQAEASANNALVVLVNEGQLSAYGKGSRFGLIHDTFGFKAADDKIEASTHGQSVSYEYVLEKNPGILFVVDRTKAIGGDDSKDNVAANELIQKTDAGKNGKVIMLQPDVWYLSGGGLESMHLMIEDVKKGLE
ncbi:TPA: siderophore ABC transporter substrate-binding protein [Enterococcus faecalis]|uniref:siderophore ABC transporter substrate-binding protein n=1 Tax=Enterococcus faecalis TaxID=1351 RepID=UPI000D50773A|nr:siderophore ABC transporter substrate-binding protein [Enterococcus faecalis]EGO5147241.1 siderophore ABC transporter substrate-binding protein [Enterococcus faecalis]EHA3055279.1 siderophore ABC transporter substrate-binding protein [Enterococcus faecalis]EJM6076529.1 siderophore ABC transporter substrate-binding protein [Enterococcus faecalis]EJZ8441001.1 siderophore ABC transporter substrate-binding protein [Enterococcus faecalis]EME3218727.1 siderophore ABC transporter substrate-binding